MATLQNIRSKGPLLVGAIAIALFAFIAGDALRVFQPSQPHDVGEVNGKALSIREYQTRLESYTGQNSLPEAQYNAVKDQIWDSYITNQLFSEEAEKIGLAVTNEELGSVIDSQSAMLAQYFPLFTNEAGLFDKESLYTFIREYENMKNSANPNPEYLSRMHSVYMQWINLEQNLTEQHLIEKYSTLVAAGLAPNNSFVENNYDERVNQVDLLVASIPYVEIEDDKVEVTNADLQKEYEAQKDNYRLMNETRKIKYVDVHIKPSAEDVQELEAEVAEYADMLREGAEDYSTVVDGTAGSEFPFLDAYLDLSSYPQDVNAKVKDLSVGETYGPYANAQDATINAVKLIDKKNLPGTLTVQMIQLANLEADALAKKTDSIVNVLNQGGDFDAIAKEELQPAEPMTITEQMMLSNMDNIKFYSFLQTMKKNEVKVWSAMGGNVIVKMVDTENFSDKYKLAIIKREMTIGSETATKAYNEFSQFVAENKTIDSMMTNAEEAGYLVLSDDLSASKHGVGSIASTKEALRWAFSAKQGEVSNIYECGEANNHLLVVGVVDIIPAGYMPLKYVQDDVKRSVLNKKKADYIFSQVQDINPKSIEDITTKIDVAVVDTVKHVTFSSPAFIAKTVASESIISGYAAVGKEGEISTPLKGEQGVYVVKVLNRNKTEEEFDAETERIKLERQIMGLSNYMFIKSDLVKNATILDNRYLYF